MRGRDLHRRQPPASPEEPVGESGSEIADAEVVEAETLKSESKPGAVYRISHEPPQAIVVHCGDPRFQEAFRMFITRDLGFRNYVPVIIGGGIHAFGVQSLLPKNFKILWEQIKFFIKEVNLHEVVFINHEDCAWYKKMKGYHGGIELPVKGKLDLGIAARHILHDFSGVNVRTFWAGLDGDVVTFSEISHP